MKQSFAAALALSSLLLGVPPTQAQTGRPAYTPSAVQQSAFRTAVEGVTAAQLKDYLTFVASDEMEGRVTPSRGHDVTARFIATLLSRWGLKPGGGNGSYFQPIDLVKQKLSPGAVEVAFGKRTLSYGRDYLVLPSAGEASGGLVFAGDGWFIKAKGSDPYERIDPKGKIVVLTQGGLPAGVSRDSLGTLGRRGEDWVDPMTYAQRKGAAGIIVLPTLLNQANAEGLAAMRRRFEDGQVWPEKLPRGGRVASSLPTVYLLAGGAQALFAGEKVDAATILQSFPSGTPVQPFELSSRKQARISVKTDTERIPSRGSQRLLPPGRPRGRVLRPHRP